MVGGAAVTCASEDNLVGSSTRVGTAAALLGAVACVDTAAVAYRATLSGDVAGQDRSTINIYGPFENREKDRSACEHCDKYL